MEDFSDILLVTDLDGTFFGAEASVVPRNMEAIEYFKAGGGRFTIATGRLHWNIKSALPEVSNLVNAPIISCNGALMYDMRTDETLTERVISSDLGRDVVEYVKKNYPDVGIRISTPEGFVTSDEMIAVSSKLLKDVNSNILGKYTVIPLEKWFDYRWYKIVIRGEHERLAELCEDMLPIFGDRIEMCRSGASFLEMQSVGTNKGVLLEYLRRYCEEETGHPVTVWCCGDYENDLQMLEKADVSVCPANAIEEVKDICDMCLCDHTEGLMADIVETIIRQKGGDRKF